MINNCITFSEKGFVSSVYKELLQMNKKITYCDNKLSFSIRILMATKHNRRYQNALVTRKIKQK